MSLQDDWKYLTPARSELDVDSLEFSLLDINHSYSSNNLEMSCNIGAEAGADDSNSSMNLNSNSRTNTNTNTNTTTAVALMATFENKLGVTMDDLRDAVAVMSEDNINNNNATKNNNTNTMLRFCASETCKFVKQEVVKKTLKYALEPTETTSVEGEFVASVLRQRYTIETEWELSIRSSSGSGSDSDSVVVKNHEGATRGFVRLLPDTPASYYQAAASTSTSTSTFPEATITTHDDEIQEVSFEWLVQQIDALDIQSHFAMDPCTSPRITKPKMIISISTMSSQQQRSNTSTTTTTTTTSDESNSHIGQAEALLRSVTKHTLEITTPAAATVQANALSVPVVRIPFRSCEELEAIVIDQALPCQFHCYGTSIRE